MSSILHPTDLSSGSEAAFLLALRLAMVSHGKLTVLHVTDDGSTDLYDLPGVRDTLVRWGYLGSHDDMSAFEALGFAVRKVVKDGQNPVAVCLDHLERHPADLIVLATHEENGRSGWLKRRVAEPLSRGAGEPCLLVPHGSKPLVDPATGEVYLRRFLVPVADKPDPQRALEAAMALADRSGIGDAEFTLLHVGNADDAPHVEPLQRDGWSFTQLVREGDVVDTIVRLAESVRADVVVMTTAGHDGFLDALRGSTTERVLRALRCPLLAVPS